MDNVLIMDIHQALEQRQKGIDNLIFIQELLRLHPPSSRYLLLERRLLFMVDDAFAEYGASKEGLVGDIWVLVEMRLGVEVAVDESGFVVAEEYFCWVELDKGELFLLDQAHVIFIYYYY